MHARSARGRAPARRRARGDRGHRARGAARALPARAGAGPRRRALVVRRADACGAARLDAGAPAGGGARVAGTGRARLPRARRARAGARRARQRGADRQRDRPLGPLGGPVRPAREPARRCARRPARARRPERSFGPERESAPMARKKRKSPLRPRISLAGEEAQGAEAARPPPSRALGARAHGRGDLPRDAVLVRVGRRRRRQLDRRRLPGRDRQRVVRGAGGADAARPADGRAQRARRRPPVPHGARRCSSLGLLLALGERARGLRRARRSTPCSGRCSARRASRSSA